MEMEMEMHGRDRMGRMGWIGLDVLDGKYGLTWPGREWSCIAFLCRLDADTVSVLCMYRAGYRGREIGVDWRWDGSKVERAGCRVW